jgi:hypothetical protein
MPRTRKPGPAVSTSTAFSPTDHEAEGLKPTDSPHVFFNEKPWKGKSARRGRPVDLLYALKAGNTKLDPNIEIVCGRLEIETDPLQYAIPFAEAVAEQIHDNIMAGKNPSGRASKPLNEKYEKYRGSSGPRGVRTGKTLSTMYIKSGTSMGGLGRAWCFIKMAQPYSRGQFGKTFNGARFTYNPKDPKINQALEDLVNIILAPDDGTGRR